jgi:GxxExxY protein
MLLHEELTEDILNAFYEVYNDLGYGFLEKVYQNALFYELKERAYEVIPQQRCPVYYKGKEVGEYFSDMVVEGLVILELKAVDSIIDVHKKQLQNYLKASSIEVGLILNFGKKPSFHRSVFFNEAKTNLPLFKKQ